jgi:tRNA modification GTPase
MYHGWVVSPTDGKHIDEIFACHMRSPNSYTGEDVVELYCHGGTMVLDGVLGLVIESGARPAERGEFTKRAFLNGKMGLIEAEAVLDLVLAKTPVAAQSAAAQLAGGLSIRIRELRSLLLELLAEVEAALDFPEDVEELEAGALSERIGPILGEVDVLLRTAEAGRLLREGVRMAIVGKPNVGKSSLLNALLGVDRAIVTSTPGTTRDTIEEVVNINGRPIVVIDTAGIRHPKNQAEEFGVERARKEIRQSDVVLVVLDASAPLTDEDKAVLDETREAAVVLVLNKVDLGIRMRLNGYGGQGLSFGISALLGTGIEDLKAGLFRFVLRGGDLGGVDSCAVNTRHKECLLRAKESLQGAVGACEERKPSDLISLDLRGAVVALGELSGLEVSEEIISEIFDRFCVGK